MRKKLPLIFMIIIFLAGLGIMLYPFISNLYVENRQGGIINDYEKVIDNTAEDTLKKEKEKAHKYNELLTGNVMITDPFDPKVKEQIDKNKDYFNILSLDEKGTMGYISIPKINVNLPIYHGTSEESLKKGVGHLENTSFPIGGKGTHAVLSSHTGLSSAKLFTDLDQVEEGNIFIISILGEKIAYKVDQIKVVLPNDSSDLVIERDKDYVTLVTCTPYSVNSHRLLVRGERTEYTEELQEEIKLEEKEKVESTWKDEYFKALTTGLIIVGVILLILILFIIIKRSIRRKNKE